MKMFSHPGKYKFLVWWFHNTEINSKTTGFEMVEEYINKCLDFPIAVCDISDEEIKMLQDDVDEFKAHGIKLYKI